MKIHEIPGKLVVTWQDDVKAIVDTWFNYFVTLEEFTHAVMVKGLDYAKANGGVAWIVDSSNARGVFRQEIQAFIESDVFPSFVENGIKFFITITSNVSALTKLNVSSYSAKVGPSGLQLLEVNSFEDAVEWLKTRS